MVALAGFKPVSISPMAARHAMCVGWLVSVTVVILCVSLASQMHDSQDNTMGEQGTDTHRSLSFWGGPLKQMGPLPSMLLLLRYVLLWDASCPAFLGAICQTTSGAACPYFTVAVGPLGGDLCTALVITNGERISPSCTGDLCLLFLAKPSAQGTAARAKSTGRGRGAVFGP
jgi:hypothetical protein